MRPGEALDLLARYYDPQSRAYALLKDHGEQVAQKALAVAQAVPTQHPDLEFVRTASLLHDIGIYLTRAPGLDCHGTEPYVRHGVLGRELLDRLGHPRHALVCERHVGAGISAADVRRFNLPLPARDMLPVSTEEVIVCYADKFFSKNGGGGSRAKSLEEITAGLRPHGKDQVERFMSWARMFGDAPG